MEEAYPSRIICQLCLLYDMKHLGPCFQATMNNLYLHTLKTPLISILIKSSPLIRGLQYPVFIRMFFNSIDFAIFLPMIFGLYWFVTQRNLKAQNTLLLLASYFFYGYWDWRFLSLIVFSSFIDYSIGLKLSSTNKKLTRKLLLCTSLVVNLGFLAFFKYSNFYRIES